MAYKCSVPKYGTILYRYGGDIFHSLTLALTEGQRELTAKSTSVDEEQSISSVCSILNKKLHGQINKMIYTNSAEPQAIELFNIDSLIEQIDPTIWSAICRLTETATQTTTHVKKIRRVYALCNLLFTINRKCSLPLHTLITEIVDTCGGSHRLKQILNRLGICSSSETHNRYIASRVEKKRNEGILTGIAMNYPITVSADNLDYRQSYSRVYHGNQVLVGMVPRYNWLHANQIKRLIHHKRDNVNMKEHYLQKDCIQIPHSRVH